MAVKRKPVPATKKQKRRSTSSYFFLALILVVTAVIYFKTAGNGFVTWDDPEYISDNALIKDFSLHGIGKLFTSFYEGNYHPLTALSNSIEYHFYGLNPKPYHII